MVASDIAVTGVTIGTVDHGAGLDATEIGRSAAIETVLSGTCGEHQKILFHHV
jgi:hypothetical protein